MVTRSKKGALTAQEKRIVKRLLDRGWRNQDIQALINIERNATINSARITEVKGNDVQRAASEKATDFFIKKKRSYDPKTGLNFYDDERLIRAREAMILAVQVFNSPSLNFKTEVFAVLANIAWTYLLHEHYEREGVKIVGDDGRSLLLSQMIERQDIPLTEGMKNNLRAMKRIRDDVEHLLLRKSDVKWMGIYQANCLNFETLLCKLFSQRLTLSNDLAFALQFTKVDFEQVVQLNDYDVPESIEALDARLVEGLSKEQLSDIEYQFRVIYTMDAASKSLAHMQFVTPESDEGKEIRRVLVKHKSADELYPFKPNAVWRAVRKATQRKFSSHDHTTAWKQHKVRPSTNAKAPEETNKKYCIYHPTHKDYTYSQAWVDFLIEQIN